MKSYLALAVVLARTALAQDPQAEALAAISQLPECGVPPHHCPRRGLH